VNVAHEHFDAALCPDCHAELASDQAYCINCGLPVAAAREPAGLLEETATPSGNAVAAAPSGRRLMILPGLEMSLGLAVAVFALVLGLGAWAGAASMQGGGPLRYALAGVTGQGPQDSGTGADSGALGADAGADLGADALAGDTLDTGTLDAGIAGTDLTTAPVDEGTSGGGTGGGSGGGGGGSEEEAPTPQLSNVWLISLNDQSFEKLYDTAGAARAGASADGPYLATTLTKAGALVPDLFGVTRGSLAAQVALVSGQGPNPATREDCPSFSEVSGAEPGKYDQAPGSGCGYPANYATIADLLTGAEKRSKVYAGVGDRLDGGAPALCRPPAPGSRPATGPLPFPLFASFTGDPECSSKVASTAALAEDAASKEKAPAFSFVLPGPCEDASDRPCQDGSPAGVAPANAFLRRTVEAIRDSAAYKAGGAIIITASQSAPGGENPDNSACCEDRPWYGKDTSTSGGGRVGALILSPLVKGGTVVDGRFDHYDLLRTIADSLGVRRPGLAAHPKVTGLPRSVWSAWNGKKPAAAEPVE
jgi:hypothetical protein